MEAFIALFVLLVPLFATFGLVFALFGAWLWFRKHRVQVDSRRHPLKEPLLRPPGYTVGQTAESKLAEGVLSLMMAPFLAVMMFGVHAGQTAYFGQPESAWRTGFTTVVTLLGMGWLLRQGFRNLLEHRNYRLGWEGELAVAEALRPLHAKGFHIFHDVPATDFNIDHVVVGPSGVFAIETKARVKRGKSRKAHEVKFDGTSLHFPGYVTRKPVEQARAQAQWLKQLLSKAIAQPIDVQPVLFLPGWWVERTQRGDVVVMSGKNSDGYFAASSHGNKLDAQTVGMLAHQLEQRCRDVALGERLL